MDVDNNYNGQTSQITNTFFVRKKKMDHKQQQNLLKMY